MEKDFFLFPARPRPRRVLEKNEATYLNNLFYTQSMYLHFFRGSRGDESTSFSFGDFNTDNVKYMSELFGNCLKLKKIDLSKFNTSKVNDMSYMFNKYNQLKELIINPKTFISKETKNMARMFDECTSLKKINLSSFNTEKVVNI